MRNLFRRAAAFTLASSVLVSATACNGPTTADTNLNTADQVNSFAKTKDAKYDWVIAVHLAADNNLYQFGLTDMNEMEAGLNNDKVKFVVLFDGAKQGDSAVYEIQKDPAGMNKTLVSKIIPNTGLIPSNNEVDSGDPKLANKFANWVVDNYPAKHNGFVFWNHGAGWERAKNSFVSKPTRKLGEISTNEFCWDDNGSNMSTTDLNSILQPAAQKMGKNWDILNFDACLMAHTEVGYQARKFVDYLVASEKTEPGDGNEYKYLSTALSANSSMTGEAAAQMFVKSYKDSYQGQQVTLSAADLKVLEAKLAPAIDEFADAMVANLATDKVELKALRSKTAVFENFDCADLGHFALQVSKSAKVSAAVKDSADKVVKELAKTVVANHSSANPNAQGLMMYFPSSGTVKARYDKLEFATHKWDEFIKAFVK